jgi:hypothetical protein
MNFKTEIYSKKIIYFEYFLILMNDMEVKDLTILKSLKLFHFICCFEKEKELLKYFSEIELFPFGHYNKMIYDYFHSENDIKYNFIKNNKIFSKYTESEFLLDNKENVGLNLDICKKIKNSIKFTIKKNPNFFKINFFELLKLNRQHYSYKVKKTDLESLSKEDKFYQIQIF